VEGLLSVKDNDTDVDPELNLLIQRLAVISDRHTFAGAPVPVEEPAEEPADEADDAGDAPCENGGEAEVAVEAEESLALTDSGREPEPVEAEMMADDAQSEELADAGHADDVPEVAEIYDSGAADVAADDAAAENALEEEALEADDVSVPEPEAMAEPVAVSAPVADEEPMPESQTIQPQDVGPVDKNIAVTPAELRRAFSLNDIFFYRRTLFGGSPERFDRTLEAVASMRGVNELRRYLAEHEQVNVKSAPAKEFMAVLAAFLDD
ncbi:MAG: hypothetical protein K2K36_01515, partial [Muribaculaceae bacterium]|nr:hypothetical protein [Muribaculaceae bacterium]